MISQKNGGKFTNNEMLEMSVAIREGAEHLKEKGCKNLAKHFNKIADEIYFDLEKKGYFKNTQPF